MMKLSKGSLVWFCCSQIPVPVFLPTTLQSAEHIVKTIDELKAKVPADPLEADLIAMAEMIAEEDKKPDCLGVQLSFSWILIYLSKKRFKTFSYFFK